MTDEMSFWEHLEALRGTLLRALLVTVVAAIVCFCFKDELFALVLWPTHNDFITYRLLDAEPFSLRLINTELTEQFMVHLRVSFFIGLLVASPYIIFELFRFISPALYSKERRWTKRITVVAYILFLVGVVLDYLLIFPLTVRFLGGYQVSADVNNMLSISNYVDTLMSMSLAFGVVFELPVVSGMLAWARLLRSEWMTRVRRHSVVVILIVAAVLTPTGDIFTLLVVSIPIYLLYEASILVVRLIEK